jgi:hypothetical protein
MSSFSVKAPTNPEEKAHPWRRCPIGKHFVKEHSIRIPPSKKHPNGCVTIRHAHCAANRSHKDQLSYDEIQYITNTYFSSLQGPPAADKLKRKATWINAIEGLQKVLLKTIPTIKDKWKS